MPTNLRSDSKDPLSKHVLVTRVSRVRTFTENTTTITFLDALIRITMGMKTTMNADGRFGTTRFSVVCITSPAISTNNTGIGGPASNHPWLTTQRTFFTQNKEVDQFVSRNPYNSSTNPYTIGSAITHGGSWAHFGLQ